MSTEDRNSSRGRRTRNTTAGGSTLPGSPINGRLRRANLEEDPSDDDSLNQPSLSPSKPASRVNLLRASPTKNAGTLVKPVVAYLDENTDDEDYVHFSLQKTIQPSKYSHLLKIRPKLDGTNYSTWSTNIYRALKTVGLHNYLDDDFAQPTDDEPDGHCRAIRWAKANSFVAQVLTSCMNDEIMTEISHIPIASQIYSEIHRQYAGTTTTDWTLSVTSLVATRYTDGGDINAHIAKMKSFRRDLVAMNRDIGDELFACFLRISMPSSWNHVFSGLSDHYTSAEVERRIRDEYAVRSSRTGTSSTSYLESKVSRSGLSKTPIPGQPYCSFCKVVGHWERDCRTKRGKEQKEKDNIRKMAIFLNTSK